jgi:F-type H+-transporting ATPase subunit alpha
MPVERQVVIIYAGTNGYLDKHDPAKLGEYERQLSSYLEKSHPDIYKGIVASGKVDDALKAKLDSALKAFEGVFA